MTDATKINRDELVTAAYNRVTGADGEGWNPDSTLGALYDLHDAVIAHLTLQATTPPVDAEWEWEYARAVGPFGWPQGYPEPCGKGENPTHRRTKAVPAGPWEEVPHE